MLSKLDLDPKCQGHSRNQKLMTWGTKNMPPKKNLSRGCLSNWCDADEDAAANSSKTICRPPPYRGVDIIKLNIKCQTWFSVFQCVSFDNPRKPT